MKTKKQSALNIVINTCAITVLLTPQLTGATDTGRVLAQKQKEKATPVTKDIFDSCKGVKYVPKMADSKKASGKNDNCPNCDAAHRTQQLPEVGLSDFYVQDGDLAEAQDFLGQCTTRVIAINQTNEKDLAHRASCFEKANKDKSGCAAIRKEAYDQITKYSPQLRMDLALSHPASDLAPANPENGDLPPAMKGALLSKTWKAGHVTDMDVDTALLGVGSLNNPFEGQKLSKTEAAAALAKLKAEDATIAQKMKKVESDAEAEEKTEMDSINSVDPLASNGVAVGTSTRIHGAQNDMQKAVREKYQADYARVAYGSAKIFAVLGNPKSIDDNGVAHYTDDQIRDAYKALAKNAAQQESVNQAAIDRKTVEFKGATRLSADNLVASLTGKRDLLDCMMFKPVVEQLLKEHPEYCGIATGLAMHEDYVKTQNAIATGGGMVALMIASGGFGAAADAGIAGAGAAAFTANVAAATLAVGMDVGYDVSSTQELNNTKAAVLSDRGEGAKMTMDPNSGGQTIRDQEFSRDLQVGLTALDIPMAAGSVKVVQQGLKTSETGKAAIASLEKATGNQATLTQKTKAAMTAFIGKDQNQVKTKLFNDFVKKTAGRNPASITEREATNKAAVVQHLLRDVDPANETDVRASGLALRMMSESKPDTFDWEGESFGKFNDVFERVKADLSSKSSEELSKIEKSSEEQRKVFQQALKEEGADDKDLDELTRCWERDGQVFRDAMSAAE